MAVQPKYRCPVCKKPLTKNEFERAFKIHEGQKQHIEARERRIAEKEQRFKAEKKNIRKEARKEERKRTSRIVSGKDVQIGKLKEIVRLLKRGQTPQEYGPEFEKKMVTRLKAEFPNDDIQHKGKAGDILHIVMEGGKAAGTIVYECKWTPRISRNHVRQAAQAKMSRHAEFAILVTCGTKPGFSGITEMFGVTIVAPAGVLAVVGWHRNHLVEMFRAGIEKKRRMKIANQLLNFIKSPEFKNAVEEVVRTAECLRKGITEEFKWHKNDWERRWNAYGRIRWDAFKIQQNLQSVLNGGKSKQMIQPKERLSLPAPTGNGRTASL